MLDLSRCILKVNGLAAGKYRVSIEGKPAGTLDADELAAGWNVTFGSDGQPGPELFVADKLHPSAEGYKIRTKLLRPALDPK